MISVDRRAELPIQVRSVKEILKEQAEEGSIAVIDERTLPPLGKSNLVESRQQIAVALAGELTNVDSVNIISRFLFSGVPNLTQRGDQVIFAGAEEKRDIPFTGLTTHAVGETGRYVRTDVLVFQNEVAAREALAAQG